MASLKEWHQIVRLSRFCLEFKRFARFRNLNTFFWCHLERERWKKPPVIEIATGIIDIKCGQAHFPIIFCFTNYSTAYKQFEEERRYTILCWFIKWYNNTSSTV